MVRSSLKNPQLLEELSAARVLHNHLHKLNDLFSRDLFSISKNNHFLAHQGKISFNFLCNCFQITLYASKRTFYMEHEDYTIHVKKYSRGSLYVIWLYEFRKNDHFFTCAWTERGIIPKKINLEEKLDTHDYFLENKNEISNKHRDYFDEKLETFWNEPFDQLFESFFQDLQINTTDPFWDDLLTYDVDPFCDDLLTNSDDSFWDELSSINFESTDPKEHSSFNPNPFF